MTESPQMPNPPWWSQPGATAVLPQEPPPAPPTPPVSSSTAPRRKRPMTPWLLALALVVGGGAGGAVATAANDNGSASGATARQTLTGTTLTDLPTSTVKGTPESAASIISDSVVTVEVTGQARNQFGGSSAQSDTGSGIIIRSEGYVLTNNHVVAAAVNGGTVHLTLSDGKTVPATIVGTDPSADLAVLKVKGVAGLKAAAFANADNLKVGQAVLAVGAPLGLSNTVTQGIVSTLHRPVRTGDSTSSQAVFDAVQTDAAINPGNSGGALVNLAGAVVGINSAIATTGGASSGGSQSGNIGVGFAIPSNAATKIADQLINTGHAVHSQMGVSVQDARGTTDGAPGIGATISGVTGNGPASKAGVQTGDVVTKVDDRRIPDADTLIVAIRSHDPGSIVTLTVTRGGSTRTVRVTLGTSAAS